MGNKVYFPFHFNRGLKVKVNADFVKPTTFRNAFQTLFKKWGPAWVYFSLFLQSHFLTLFTKKIERRSKIQTIFRKLQ
jgi:hypothetical protein